MRVDLSKLRQCNNEDEIDQVVTEILNKCSPKDPPLISELILGAAEGAQPLLIKLADLYENERDLDDEELARLRFRWKIQVLCDEWGNKPVPGEEIVIKMQKSLYKHGKPIGGNVLSAAKMRGSYEDEYVKKIKYKIDEKGCVEVGYRDAVHLINNWGVHPQTGYAICRKEERSSGPVKTKDGGMLHVCYWRYREVPLVDKNITTYDQLPKIEIKSEEPKRGVAKK
jgi:hypothetical protein